MADRIATLGRERSLRTLAEKLLVIEGQDAAAKLRHAETALQRANPELADTGGFRVGRKIIVPGDIGLKLRKPDSAETTDGKGALEEIDARLHMAQKAFSQRFDTSAAADKRTLELAAERSFMGKLTKALPESAALLPKATKAIDERAETEKARGERLARAFEAAQDRMADLRALAKRNE